MSFSVFNESFYLAHNPDVQAAINAGFFSSGLEHFQKFGLTEGRVSVSPFYDENYYLQKNPDVATAVTTGMLSSGLQHFIFVGETEDRQASLLFDQQFYFRNNPSVQAAVTVGRYSSGLDHYLKIGKSAKSSGTNFNEFAYFGLSTSEKVNADVEAAVKAGLFASSLEHYITQGQFEGRVGIFSGTKGNDTVTAFGQLTKLYGVDTYIVPEVINGTLTGGQRLLFGEGFGQVDVLVGGNGQDTFVLGQSLPLTNLPNAPVYALPFYRLGGDADYALIKNYEIGKDEILLAGATSDYNFVQSGDSLNIFSYIKAIDRSDLIASVEGVTSLSQIESQLRFESGAII
ncbi:hypothetical protein ACE1B6_13785 [Aerosakkonemataceae cyanobacterium BLCC-F154]|uniref:Uncharacterized protein n=1 Tax=Floridaenema fluviatile BLCC-F154 TaxID=3153640 RepID=A0ABV4YCB1_9CYAN